MIVITILTLIGYVFVGYTIFYVISNGIAWYWPIIALAITVPVLGLFTWVIVEEMKKILKHNKNE